MSFAGRNKLRNMVYTLGEAVRKRKRVLFKSAAQTYIHHDGSENKLVARFSVLDAMGVRRCGFLSLVDLVEDYGSLGSVALAQALCKIVTSSCTINGSPPGKTRKRIAANSRVDLEAEKSLMAAVSLLDALRTSAARFRLNLAIDSVRLSFVPPTSLCHRRLAKPDRNNP